MRVPIQRTTDPTILASLTLQLLPNDRTLISVEFEPDHESTIHAFMDHLAQRLVQLGFAEEPPPPKRPLGFRLP